MPVLAFTKITGQVQEMLNDTASAQNYQLESKTVQTYQALLEISEKLPADPSRSSRNAALFAAWIRWLCVWENYAQNLLHRRRLLGYLNRLISTGRFSLEIYPYATRIYGITGDRHFREIRIHEAMDDMNDEECRRFAQAVASCRWKDLKETVRQYQERSPHYQELVLYFREQKAAGEPVNNTKGTYYDLEQVFNTCNRNCFGGKMPRPRGLHWSARVNHATMGSYNLNEDTVMINRGLDKRSVPAYVLDFVMYHELLHKALGVKNVNNRNQAHTPEFRKFEQAHPYYQQAQDFIKKNAAKL